MFHETTFPPPDGRLAQLMRLVDECERTTIEEAVERLIAKLDREDGPLVEDEPNFAILIDGMPGTIEDAEPCADSQGDVGWTEWHNRWPRLYRHAHESIGAPGAQDDDEPYGDEQDHNSSEDDFLRHEGTGPGCFIADTGIAEGDGSDEAEEDGPDERLAHAARLQRTRCKVVRYSGQAFYQLRNSPGRLPGVPGFYPGIRL